MPKLAYRSTMPKPDDPSLLYLWSAAIAKGHPIATAANLAGIHERTAYDWLALGNAVLDAAPPGTSAEELGSHAPFAQAQRDAQAALVERNLTVIEQDMADATPGKRWMNAMTLLERRMPQHFGRRTYEERSVSTVSLRVELPEAAAGPLLALLRERLGTGSPPAEDIVEGVARDASDTPEGVSDDAATPT